MTFKLVPNPTFEETVTIPVPGGGGNGKIKIKFKRIGKKSLRALFATMQEDAEKEDVDVLLEVVDGWSGVDAEFTEANLATMADNYPGFTAAVVSAYSKAMFEAKAKN